MFVCSVFVGAPRADSTYMQSIVKSGLLYKCSLEKGDCVEFFTSATGESNVPIGLKLGTTFFGIFNFCTTAWTLD